MGGTPEHSGDDRIRWVISGIPPGAFDGSEGSLTLSVSTETEEMTVVHRRSYMWLE